MTVAVPFATACCQDQPVVVVAQEPIHTTQSRELILRQNTVIAGSKVSIAVDVVLGSRQLVCGKYR